MNRQTRSVENANEEQRPHEPQHVRRRRRRRAQHYMGLHGKDNAPEPPAITPEPTTSPASSSSYTPPNPTPPPQRPSSSGQAFSNAFKGNSNSSPTSDGNENSDSDSHYESDHVIEPSEAQAETHPQHHEGASPIMNDQQSPSTSSTGGGMTTATSSLQQASQRLDSTTIRPAWTSYSLFQNNLNRFDMDKLHGATHYLTSTLTGRTWLDANGDGKRGDYADATLNEMEYTMGIDGVHVQLVDCETDEPVMEAVSTSSNDNSDTTATGSAVNTNNNSNNNNNPASSVNSSAGTYTFPFQNISSGRYYFMYTAPKDMRISGNVLPLERNFPYFDCIPRGGEGDIYIKEARQRGDWDVTGYCARSIGCFEVDHKINPHSKSNFDQFSKLETLLDDENGNNEKNNDYTTFMGSMAALPTYDYMNVGLAIEKWELPAYQYADFLVTLEFPTGVDLQEAVPEDFGRSPLRKQLEEGFNEFLRRSEDNVFSVKGVDLHRGEVMSAAYIHKKSNVEDNEVEEIERRWEDEEGDSRVPIVIERNGKKIRRKRMLRGLLERYSGSELQAGVLVNQLTYTLTARGSYRPPPYKQLGQAIQEAINSDPKGFVKELKDKEALPEVFHTVEDVKATHLTVAMPKKTIAVPQVVEEPTFFQEYGLFIGIGGGIFAILICISCICRRELVKRRQSRRSAGGSDDYSQRDYQVKQVHKMKVRAIKAELESYGIPTERLLEKKTLVDALVTARTIGMVPIHDAQVQYATMQSKASPGGSNSHDTSKTFNNSSSNFSHTPSYKSHASDGWKPASILRKNPTPVKQRVKFSLTTFRNSFSSSEATPPTPKTKASGRPRTAGPAGPGRFNPYATNAPSATSDGGRAQHSIPIFNGKLRATIRDRRIQEATKNLEHLKIGELRSMLIALGIDSSSFVEKSEFVRALAAARVDGVKEKNVGAFPTSSSSPSSGRSKSKAEKKRSQSYTSHAKMGYSFTRDRQSRRSSSYTKGTERKQSYGTDPLDSLFDDDFSLGSLSPTNPSSPPAQPVDPPHQQSSKHRRTSSRPKTRSRSPHPAHKSHSRSHSRDPPSPHQRRRTGSSSKPRSGSSSNPRTGSSSKTRAGSSSKTRSGSSSKPRTGSSTRQSSRPRAGSSSRQRTPESKGRSSSNPRHSSSSHDHKKYQQRTSYHSAPNQDHSSSQYGSHHRPRSSSPYHRAHGKDEARPRSSSPYSKQDSIRSDLKAADKFNKSEPWMF